eukprot:INCI19590.2.p1 GENE.INCI19590.2~~INCI19590.2.p1  ORF type:complete len:452 (-),score=35.91 INCI19590.2:470-1825(-)
MQWARCPRPNCFATLLSRVLSGCASSDTFWNGVWLAVALRVCLVAFGAFQDANFAVKYTDVDYEVCSDAAALMAQGGSPFGRTTYRYSPLLAAMLLPNIWLHKSCGKLLFAAADVVVALLTREIVRAGARSLPRQPAAASHASKPGPSSHARSVKGVAATDSEFMLQANYWGLVWLFNPLAMNMSSRGNADAVVLAMVLGTIALLNRRKWSFAAVLFGLSVHFRIYPIVYAPAFVVHIWQYAGRSADAESPGAHQSNQHVHRQTAKQSGDMGWLRRSMTVAQFGSLSASIFLGLTACTYRIYGYQGLYESLLYHAVRSDNRHNFSAYFYALYLRHGSVLSLLAFVPQLLLPIVLAIRLVPRSLSLGLYATTVVFVAFNKVCTAQYFMWWAVFLPLVLPHVGCGSLTASADPLLPQSVHSRISKGVALGILWATAEAHWLYWAYVARSTHSF